MKWYSTTGGAEIVHLGGEGMERLLHRTWIRHVIYIAQKSVQVDTPTIDFLLSFALISHAKGFQLLITYCVCRTSSIALPGKW